MSQAASSELASDAGNGGPASFGQSALWRAREISAHPSAFNLLWSVKFRGPLDPGLLTRALARVVERQDALRARFDPTPLGLEQHLLPPGGIECPMVALEGVSAPTLDELSRQFGHEPFDLGKGPLFRFKLARIGPLDHVLLSAFHHLVIDGHSWQLFVDELARHLAGAAVPPPEIRYSDFCAWQRRQRASDNWNPARDFWMGRYLAAPAAALPTDRPRPGLPDNAGAAYSATLPAAVAARLRKAAARGATSPFRIAFAAFFALLHRLTGQADILIATTLIGRRDPRFASLVGFFVNTAGVRLRIEDAMRFDSLAAALDTEIDALVEHEDYPFSLAAQDAATGREPGPNPFAPVAFTKLPTSRLRHVAGLEISEERVFLDEANQDLSVYMQDDRGAFRFTWVYRSGMFDHPAIERLAGWFQELLGDALERPESPVRDLELVPPCERRRILGSWNDTRREFPEARSLHGLVEAQAARTPDRIAVVAPGAELTYRQVNAAANRIAAKLRERGVGAGRFVPILMETSAELLIAELAVMKAGAAFAPLDPAWPKRRLGALLKRLGTHVVLVAQSDAAAFSEPGREMLIVDIRTDAGEVADPGLDVRPDDPVYCIFTSGSTGLPKGAINLHRGIVNRLSVMTERFGTAAEDSILATSPAFADSSVWQYFWPLISGGRSVIFLREEVANPGLLASLMAEHGITFMDSVPSVFRSLVTYLRAHAEARPAFGKLRRILMGGETMAADPVYEFKAMLPHVAITNTYGPTETSIGVIFHEVPAEYTNPMPIGRPIANVRAVVVDRHLKLMPVGIAGELCLGGACVGQGYLDDAPSTARAFVANPFPELDCPVLYRTGDLARFRADGIIEHLGRIDEQVKLRGIRIEPGEIEAALARHPGVRQAVVVLQEDDPADKRLVAYIVAEDPAGLPDAVGLREFLAAALPPYLIPSSFVLLDALPLTSGGKADRKAVTRIGGVELRADTPYVAPRNDLERQIVEIWQELLARDRVGVHDHFFFDLGGHSLLAILFVARLEERTGLRPGIRSLFESPTPAGLARRLLPTGPADGSEPAPPPTPVFPEVESIESILAKQRPLIAPWQGKQLSPDSFLFTLNEAGRRRGLFWCLQGFRELTQLAAHLGPDQPLHGMRSGHLILNYTDANVDALAGRYAAEMIALQPDGPFTIGGNCQGGAIARATALMLKRSGRPVSLLMLMEESSFRDYDGRVALLFGRESHLNPYRLGADPEATFRKAYPGGFTVDLIDGGHGQFFDDPNIPSLARTVTRRLAASSR
jgi:amino acid adenylation domain-containing protein